MIEKWLETFTKAWMDKDIDVVLKHFSEDVEYWESPFKQVTFQSGLAEAWQAIEAQENVELSTKVFNSDGQRHTVKWQLHYEKGGSEQNWAGVYLLELNEHGKCTYFEQIGEEKLS